jgi:membrane protein DedA with SNARE-associated domain/rhodanese-related sulfurtransferase
MGQQGAVHVAAQWLMLHGHALLAAAVLAEQLGAPLPAAPFLLAMGALAGLGHFSLVTALALSTVAALAADLVWFRLGQSRGESVLGLLCRLSLEPDTCVRLTHQAFDRYGQASLVFCKFVPGLSTVAPPLAGSSGISLGRFIVLDSAGSALWAGTYLGIGWLFRQQLERALEILERFGLWMFVALAAPIALWIAWKYAQRQLWLRRMRPERVPPKQVLPLLDGPNPPFIVDLRPLRTIERSGFKLPGAVVGSPEEIDAQILALPKDTHLVFYCSCPNDAASATYALRFRKAGFQNAIAIQGGFDAWAEAGFPVEAAAPLGSGDAAVPAVGSTMENEA